MLIVVLREIRQVTDDILEKIIWKTPGKKLSTYYSRLLETLEKMEDMGTYFIRRNEMFARWFEAWVAFELRNQNITNLLLTEPKYDFRIYPSDAELEVVAPMFRRFCRLVGVRVN